METIWHLEGHLKLYLIGSLENPEVPKIAAELRTICEEVFDCWHAAGPRADRHWEEYARSRRQNLQSALLDYPAQHVYCYDRAHLDRCDGGVLVMPAGKSGHLELGYMQGQGKPTWILFQEEPQRWDVMLAGATICMNLEELKTSICAHSIGQSGSPASALAISNMRQWFSKAVQSLQRLVTPEPTTPK